MYKHIVVGTDGSDTAAEAVRHAQELAVLCKATLHVVSAYKPESMGSVPAEFRDQVRPDSKVEALLSDLSSSARNAGLAVEVHQSRADAPEALCSVAEEVGADLIVVGNKGVSGVKRFVLGSVPNKVVQNSPCATLVVHTSG